MATRQSAGTRARDSDRNDTCQVLDTALSEGQLSMEEHRERVKAATTAATLGELRALVSDLQTSHAPVKLPQLKKPARERSGSLGLGIATFAVVLGLGVAIGWGLFGGNGVFGGGDAPDPGAQPDGVAPVVLTPPRQLHSVGGLTGLIEQMKQRFGDTMGYRLLVYPDYASFYRADPTDERRKLDYDYRGGWDDPTASTKNDTDRLIDVAQFDPKAVVGVLRGAPDTLGIKPSEVDNTYLIVDPSPDPSTPGAVTLSIHVSSEFGSGHIELAGDGTVKQIVSHQG